MSVENLQKPDLQPMRHHRQSGDGITDPIRERTDHFVHWQSEGRGHESGGVNSEATYWQNMTFSEEQQTIHTEASEVGCDQADDGRSTGGHTGRAANRSSPHGFTKDKDRQTGTSYTV
eukprot:872925-Heterocapsa_arctica.AAC.1